MYGYIFFAFSLICIFSIIENLKGRQRLSFLKLHIVALLFFISLSCFIYFLDELGYEVNYAIGISRLISAVFFVNLFFVLSQNRVPTWVCQLPRRSAI